jgi:hypothetical protein
MPSLAASRMQAAIREAGSVPAPSTTRDAYRTHLRQDAVPVAGAAQMRQLAPRLADYATREIVEGFDWGDWLLTVIGDNG